MYLTIEDGKKSLALLKSLNQVVLLVDEKVDVAKQITDIQGKKIANLEEEVLRLGRELADRNVISK